MKLKIENLTKYYDEKLILKDINFTFEDGKIYGLIGRNGAGKTTLFNAINNDIEINEGNILLDDKNINFEDIGYVTAIPLVPEFLTAREFIKFFIDINKEKIKDQKPIDYYFELVKIKENDRDKLLKEYSQGMKNKVQMLINIISNPKLILLDEPLTSLDIVVQDDMKKLLLKQKKDHIIILSTHILELATSLCDEIVIINNKKLELIDKKNLNEKKYREKIIESLRNSDND